MIIYFLPELPIFFTLWAGAHSSSSHHVMCQLKTVKLKKTFVELLVISYQNVEPSRARAFFKSSTLQFLALGSKARLQMKKSLTGAGLPGLCESFRPNLAKKSAIFGICVLLPFYCQILAKKWCQIAEMVPNRNIKILPIFKKSPPPKKLPN